MRTRAVVILAAASWLTWFGYARYVETEPQRVLGRRLRGCLSDGLKSGLAYDPAMEACEIRLSPLRTIVH